MLAYDDLGSGEVIVFIHGLGSRKESWKPQYELAEGYRLIIPDLRGHGETKNCKNINVENFAKDIVKLLEHLNIGQAFICGLSLGGIVAQEFYKQRPDMVKGLILANTASYIPFWLASGVLFNLRDKYKKKNFIANVAEHGLYNKAFKEEAMKGFLIRSCYMEAAKAAVGLNYTPVLLGITKPVLLIGGTHDNVTPLLNMCYMELFLKDPEKVVLAAGHLSNVERKEEFNKAIDAFIQSN